MIKFAFFRPEVSEGESDPYDLSFFGYVCYYLTNTIAVPISISLIFLTISLILQMYNNMTSLERLGMKTIRMPCYGPV